MTTNIRLRLVFRSFLQGRSGSVAVPFALMMLPLLGMVGLAVDYGSALSVKSKVAVAADAAALAAAQAASGVSSQGLKDWAAQGQATGERFFNANLTEHADVEIVSLGITVDKPTQSFRGTVEYTVNVKTHLLGIFNVPHLVVQNTVVASADDAPYVSVHLLIDASPSMGIGANAASQTIMFNKVGCAIACHFSTTGATGNFASVRTTAAVLRIDVVRNSVKEFIRRIKASAGVDHVQISIDLFSSQLYPLLSPTTDLSAALAAAGNIDLFTQVHNTGTNIHYSLSQVASELKAGGDGSSVQSRKSYVVLISDGIENSVYGISSGTPGKFKDSFDPNFLVTAPSYRHVSFEAIQTISDASCNAVKRANHTLITGQIEYLIPAQGGNDIRFQKIAATFTPTSKVELRQCATSPDMSFFVTKSEDIEPLFMQISDVIAKSRDIKLTR